MLRASARWSCIVFSLVLLSIPTTQAAPYDEMDYGPFISATYQLPGGNDVLRGVAVRFHAPIEGEKGKDAPKDAKGKTTGPKFDPAECGIIFDTELLRVAGYWNGGFITWRGVVFNGDHGSNPGPAGPLHISTKPTPGWAKDGKFDDPRKIPHGPLPRDHARYKGLYRHEDGIVFSYTVGGVDVLDMPKVIVVDGKRILARTLNIAPTKTPLKMVIADLPFFPKNVTNVGSAHLIKNGGEATIVLVKGGPKGTEIPFGLERLVLDIPASDKASQIAVGIWKGPEAQWEAAAKALDSMPSADLASLIKGGKARFTETVTTQGKRGDDKQAYTIDSIEPPFKNPYKSWMRFGGFDFFKDGKAAVCTWSGDVWVVSGIDDKLENVTWKRYAAGLFQPLGLKIVDDVVYTLGRDGLMKLTDLNNDGEADLYECHNNDFMVTTNFHEFIFDLHTDPEGNFYFIKGGPVRPGGRGWDKIVPHHGCIFKVSKDGSKLEVVARGFRAPNGMGVGPKGEIVCGDNEGTWTPTVPINWIKKDGFYGVPEFASKDPKTAVRENPLCWMPRPVDNSNGGQVWITGDKFGPLSGQMLHCSYGTSTLYSVMKEEVGGEMQGGVVPLLKFDSGICRARFYEDKNVLFLTGLRGWQTNASKDAGLYRVRYTGQKYLLPTALHVKPGKVEITFATPLDKSFAADADNYSVKRWNYRWTEAYGSPHFKPSNPKVQGEEEVEVEAADLSSDGKTVTLTIKDLKPVMQMKVTYNLKAADGAQVKNTIHHTINVVGGMRAELHPGELRIVPKK